MKKKAQSHRKSAHKNASPQRTEETRQAAPHGLGQLVEVTAYDLNDWGQGVARLSLVAEGGEDAVVASNNSESEPIAEVRGRGMCVFVSGLLPGESAKIRLEKKRSRYVVGQIQERLNAVPERQSPKCAVYGRCGGCSLQHLAYQAQLRWKVQKVRHQLLSQGALSEAEWADLAVEICPSPQPWAYRTRAQLPVARIKGRDGEKIAIGAYARGSHQVVDSQDCPIQHAAIECCREALRPLLIQAKAGEGLYPLSSDDDKGNLRHLVFQLSLAEQRVLLTLVMRQIEALQARELSAIVEDVQEKLRDLGARWTLAGVVGNAHPGGENRILGREEKCLWGQPYVIEELGGIRYRISSQAFFQVNPAQAEQLYQQLADWAEDVKKEEQTGPDKPLRLCDLYCGSGTIGLRLLTPYVDLLGVECVEAAVMDAEHNAHLNQAQGQARFMAGPAEGLWQEVQRLFKPDLLVVDPPRRGLDADLTKRLVDEGPEHLLYVSCDPGTLGRDLHHLRSAYQLRALRVFDMFPQTTHVETVCLMTRVR